jgi:hypothetical protein
VNVDLEIEFVSRECFGCKSLGPDKVLISSKIKAYDKGQFKAEKIITRR